MTRRLVVASVTVVSLMAASGPRAHAQIPSFVDVTWMSMSNVYFEIGPVRVLADGYFTRLPQDAFYGGGGGLAYTRQPFKPDSAAVERVLGALGGPRSVDMLLSGHSHFDHSFDAAVWARRTPARIVGPQTTCLQLESQGIPSERCTAVFGGELLALGHGVRMRIVRWNHSGDPSVNPEQHDPVELREPPRPDPRTGGLRAGVAEDFPNGGGSRGFLFVVDGPDGRFSWFFQNSTSAVALDDEIIVDGREWGAPIANLRDALAAEGLDGVDLWIGTGGAEVARIVLPTLEPKAYLPVHWDGLWSAFEAGVPRPYSDSALEQLLQAEGVELIRPGQYFDKWRLDRSGVRPMQNTTQKQALGFRDP